MKLGETISTQQEKLNSIGYDHPIAQILNTEEAEQTEEKSERQDIEYEHLHQIVSSAVTS